MPIIDMSISYSCRSVSQQAPVITVATSQCGPLSRVVITGRFVASALAQVDDACVGDIAGGGASKTARP